MGFRYLTRKNIKIKNPFKSIKGFLKVAEESSGNSRTNFFIQVINCFLTFLLIVAILPVRIDEYLSPIYSVKILYSYLPRIGISVLLFFIIYVFTEATGFTWSDFFKTRIRDSMRIFVSLFIICTSLYYKALTLLYKKYYQLIIEK